MRLAAQQGETLELYSNESIDEELVVEEEVDQEQLAMKQALIAESQELQLMCHTPGWKLLRKRIEEEMQINKDKLVLCTSLEQIVHLQESIKSYQSLLNLVDVTVLEGRREQELINNNAPSTEG